MTGQVWLYVARATGMIAWALLAATVVWGLLLTTRLAGRKPAPAWLLDLHRFLGGLAAAFTALHLAGLPRAGHAVFVELAQGVVVAVADDPQPEGFGDAELGVAGGGGGAAAH